MKIVIITKYAEYHLDLKDDNNNIGSRLELLINKINKAEENVKPYIDIAENYEIGLNSIKIIPNQQINENTSSL